MAIRKIAPFIMLACLLFVTVPSNAQAGVAWDNSGPDPDAKMSPILSMGTNETVMAHISATGNVTFDLYVMTEHDYDLYNKGFGYSMVDAFTNLNVTSVNVTAELEKGWYVILINSHAAGRIELADPQFTAIEPKASMPWGVIGAVVLASALSSAVTAMIVSRRYKKRV